MKDLPPLKDDDVESLFTNVALKETICYILEQIYLHNKVPIPYSKLIFRRLLEKISRKKLFQLNSKFFKWMRNGWLPLYYVIRYLDGQNGK